MPQRFGDKLRYLRQQRQQTQRDLARQLILVRQAHIANIETNRRGPSLRFVILISNFFGISTDYLLHDDIPIEDATLHTVVQPHTQTDVPHLFGAKLRHQRERANVSQTELARRLGLSAHAHISLLESGRHEPSIELVVAIANIFGATTDYLLWDEMPVKDEGQSSSISGGL